MLANPTYKQLDASLRIGAFTLGQWAQVLVAGVLALLFAVYLSPLPVGPTIFVSVVFAGSPVALSCGAMAQEWSVVDALRAQWHWVADPRKYLPGPGQTATGYSVSAIVEQRADDAGHPTHLNITDERSRLWDV
jgi:hypothetical protein